MCSSIERKINQSIKESYKNQIKALIEERETVEYFSNRYHDMSADIICFTKLLLEIDENDA